MRNKPCLPLKKTQLNTSKQEIYTVYARKQNCLSKYGN